MTEKRALWMQGASHTAEEDRQLISAIFGGGFTFDSEAPAVGSFARGHGIIRGFQVTPNGTPNNTVHVAGGLAVVRGTQQDDQGHYLIAADGSEQLTVAAAHATNPRFDLVVAQVRDDDYAAHTGDDWALELITGTPAASPVNPAVPEDALVLARLRIEGLGTENPISITSGNIDTTPGQVRAVGGITPVNSLAEWPDPQEGDVVYRMDVNRLAVFHGSVWRHQQSDFVAAGATGFSIVADNFTTFTVTFGVTFAAAPKVTGSVVGAGSGKAWAHRINNVTTTSMEVLVQTNDIASVTESHNFHWIAVGPLAA